ncbi:hypothetical protein V1477_017144 [Vespula maculifrons]|uniref:Uncharacterized protein n=1 Tax=Vespula maculifrons TaxID=7453 RepID=A0ABD2B583_VESMC
MKTSTWKHFNFRDEFGEVKGGRNAKKENCEERTLRSLPESTAASASAAAADADAGALRGRADGDAVTEKRAGRCCSKKMRTCPGLVPAIGEPCVITNSPHPQQQQQQQQQQRLKKT